MANRKHSSGALPTPRSPIFGVGLTVCLADRVEAKSHMRRANGGAPLDLASMEGIDRFSVDTWLVT